MQAKLLRVLETGELRRLGEGAPKRVDVRVVCATHRDLLAEVRLGRFRADLYYRIAGLTVTLPPLRERLDDIPLLASRFLDQFREDGAPPPRLTPEALAWLRRRPWPGNVRELRQVVGSASASAVDGVIDVAVLESVAGGAEPAMDSSVPEQVEPAAHPAGAPDAARLQQVLARHGGRRAAAARELGVTERTLYRWLSRHAATGTAARR